MRKIFSLTRDLACVTRYSQSYIAKEESVLEHTGFVCLVSMAVATRLMNAGEEIDIGKLLGRATAHDLDEVITGDIPRPTKYANDEVREALHKMETINMKEISTSVFQTSNVYLAWRNAKDDSKEGVILRVVDAMAVVYKAWHEKRIGNSSIAGHVLDVRKGLIETMDTKLYVFENERIMASLILEAIEICDEVI